MTLTPRQIDAWLEFNDKLDRIDRAYASGDRKGWRQGDEQVAKKMLKEIGPK